MVNRHSMGNQATAHGGPKGEVRPARIVEIQEEEPLRSTYSWYTSWTTGCDSIYGLLSKVAWLNGLSAREIAHLFVSSRCGRKGITVQRLNLDLREPGVFDLSKIAQLCHTTEEAVSDAFVRGKYTDRLVETCPNLRYCPQCLESGFHSALFQLSCVARCPLHHIALKQQCENCTGVIPYRLTSSLLRKPFACPHCERCFAPALRDGPRQELRMSAESLSLLERASEIACMKSRLGSAQQLGQHGSFFGRGRWVFGAPSLQRSKDEYYEFLDAILHDILSGAPNRGAYTPATDDPGSHTSVIRIVRGHNLPPPRIQRWRFHCLLLRRFPLGTGRKRAPATAKNLGASRASAPLLGPQSSGLGPTRIETPVKDPARGASRGNGSDPKLLALYPVYQAIRRQLFGRVLSGHRMCIRSAAARIHWDVEGDLIARFCPIAEAFLRWRMYWEGYGVPADLFRRPRHVAYGLRAWLCDGAPIGAEGWTVQGEQWFTHRVFAMQCIRNFYEWLAHCEATPTELPRRWRRADMIGTALTYWAAVGSDTRQEPLRVFLDTTYRPTMARNGHTYPRYHSALPH
jgi:hypothetical protein